MRREEIGKNCLDDAAPRRCRNMKQKLVSFFEMNTRKRIPQIRARVSATTCEERRWLDANGSFPV